jgi:sigma-B regulation protein RsbU (phosphoserine phosphatase)
MKETMIRRVPLFASLPDEEIGLLAAELREFGLPSGTILFREGERANCFYILLEGDIEIIKALGSADERLLGVRGPGSFIGEMSLFSPDGLRTATVRSRTGLSLLEMTQTDFDALLHRQPALAYEMVRVLSMRLNAAENATIRDLQEKNRQLTQAYEELKTAQVQLVEKERLERELEVARQIQRSILPRRLPQLDGYDLGVRMTPAQAVGGDFFDFVPLGGRRVGIAVGDVSDSGVPAAIFMALTRSLLRAEALRCDTPAEVLQSVNRHLLDMNESGMFVTLWYGVLDGDSHEVHAARAGHELPLLIGATGTVAATKRLHGQPLGIFPAPALDQQVLPLNSGETLLVYSDGVTDSLDPSGRSFGVERLKERTRDAAGYGAQVLCDALYDATTTFRGAAPQHDDVTLLAVCALTRG